MENGEGAINAERGEMLKTHRQKSIRSMVAVTLVMIIIFSVGLRAYIMDRSSSAGAFWPAVPMLLAITFAYTGLSLKSAGRPLLVASIVALCIAIIMSLVAAIIDGTVAESIHHTDFSLCHYSTQNDFIPPCVANESRRYSSYPKRYCLCCYQWRNSYIFKSWYNVDGCEDISGTFQNHLWTSMTFNVIGILVCVIACSFVAGYVSLLKPDGVMRQQGVVLPPQYIAGPQSVILGHPNQTTLGGQYRVTPSVPTGPSGDFRANLEPRVHANRQSLLVADSIM